MDIKSIVLGLALGAVSLTASADITIRNSTSSEISAIYISGSDTDDWEENVIEGYVLPAGNEFTIPVKGSYDSFDLRVESTEGGSEDYMDFPGQTSFIELKGAGKSNYK